ncbi:MAG: PaaI family thioesterase [Acidimicrobiales bacterium]|nr:PaaI family thioesterase [Acidimicrobiales bacterium]
MTDGGEPGITMPYSVPGGDFGERIAERFRRARESDSPRRAELRRFASAARLAIDRVVATNAPPEVIAAVADRLEEAAALLEGHGQGRLYEGWSESANAGDPHAFFDFSPTIGVANPLAPPMELSVVDGHIEGRVVFGAAYEGPPGCVHGGHVAAVFDELLGMAQSLGGSPGMTGSLTVRYRRPTRLHVELRLVGRLVRTEGRKLFTAGQLYDGDVLTAEAEGLFISVDFSRIGELIARRDTPPRDVPS